MSAPVPELDPMSVLVAVLSVLIGPRLAPLVGAYTLILLGWSGGVLVGLLRREPGTRISAAVFVFVTLILTLGITVPASQWLSNMLHADATGLLFPVAVLLPAVGTSWFDVAAWVWTDVIKPRFTRSGGNP